MKKIYRLLSFFLVFILISVILTGSNKLSASSNNTTYRKPINAAVFLLDFNDDFVAEIAAKLANIQITNPDKIKFTYYDGKSNQNIQNQDINKALNEDVDLILLNIVDRTASQTVINKIKEYNVPVILFNREPLTPVPIQSYSRALYIGTDGREAGNLQAEMIVNTWNTSKEFIDKNNNNVLQYVMLEGELSSSEAVLRTKYSVYGIESSGITTQQIALRVCDWLEQPAYEFIKALFQKYGDQIELIISNDDTMAIGAIKALQEYGYNTGNKSRLIPVVGVDVTPEAKELIDKELMLGSVFQDAGAYAEALYTCGINMVAGKSPIAGTNYKFDATLVAIRLPTTKYYYKNPYPKK